MVVQKGGMQILQVGVEEAQELAIEDRFHVVRVDRTGGADQFEER